MPVVQLSWAEWGWESRNYSTPGELAKIRASLIH